MLRTIFSFRWMPKKVMSFKRGQMTPNEREEYLDHNFELILPILRHYFEPTDVRKKFIFAQSIMDFRVMVEQLAGQEIIMDEDEDEDLKDLFDEVLEEPSDYMEGEEIDYSQFQEEDDVEEYEEIPDEEDEEEEVKYDWRDELEKDLAYERSRNTY